MLYRGGKRPRPCSAALDRGRARQLSTEAVLGSSRPRPCSAALDRELQVDFSTTGELPELAICGCEMAFLLGSDHIREHLLGCTFCTSTASEEAMKPFIAKAAGRPLAIISASYGLWLQKSLRRIVGLGLVPLLLDQVSIVPLLLASRARGGVYLPSHPREQTPRHTLGSKGERAMSWGGSSKPVQRRKNSQCSRFYARKT
jgi:hypothetical protein